MMQRDISRSVCAVRNRRHLPKQQAAALNKTSAALAGVYTHTSHETGTAKGERRWPTFRRRSKPHGSNQKRSTQAARQCSSSTFWVARKEPCPSCRRWQTTPWLSKGLPVIFSCDAHIPAYDKEIELWGEHGIAGSEAAKPLAAFKIQDTDIVIPKRRYNGFFGTDLDLTLRELGVDTLITVGCDTNICVLQTLAGAYYNGYKTVVAADACATFLIGTQEAGLEYFSRCYDSRVVTTDTVLSYLE